MAFEETNSSCNVVVLFLGMSRSGTSVLTRILSLCGGILPRPLVHADGSNPTGYWEPAEALRINDNFLRRFGLDWFDPTLRLQLDTVISSPLRHELIGEIRNFFESCPSASPLILKEPRITALSSFWLEAARLTGRSTKIVIPVRHPREVAASVAARDGVPLNLARALWLKYNLLAELNSRQHPRIFVDYLNVIRDWQFEVRRISDALNIRLSTARQSVVDKYVTPNYYHQRQRDTTLDVFGGELMTRTYSVLEVAAHDGEVDIKTLDEMFGLYQVLAKRI